MFKKTFFFALAVLTPLFFLAYTMEENAPAVEESKENASEVDLELLSKAFGHFIGRNLETSGVQFDLETVIGGMREAADGQDAPMTDQEYEKMMTLVQTESFLQQANKNLADAEGFLQKNAQAEGVLLIEPGKLHYLILEEGNGAAVKENSTPKIYYTGRFLDGSIFGSAEEPADPIAFPLAQTIPGFSRGLVGMKEGETRRLFVHPDLGYGTSGHLPPNSLLIFDVKVIVADATSETDDDNDSTDEEDGEIELDTEDDTEDLE